jgi:hypothetical protein
MRGHDETSPDHRLDFVNRHAEANGIGRRKHSYKKPNPRPNVKGR